MPRKGTSHRQMTQMERFKLMKWIEKHAERLEASTLTFEELSKVAMTETGISKIGQSSLHYLCQEMGVKKKTGARRIPVVEISREDFLDLKKDVARLATIMYESEILPHVDPRMEELIGIVERHKNGE